MMRIFLTIIFILINTIAFARGLDGVANPEYTFDNTFSNIGLTGTDKAIINWKDFNIAAGETVTFNQKDINSIVLNRVNSNLPTEIYGNLTANGKVFIMNNSGVIIGRGASINVGSFLATTGSITDDDFLSGNYNFTGATKNIINQGNISSEGYTVLLGKTIINDGGMIDSKGDTILASGESFLFVSENDPIVIEVTKSAIDSYIANSGTLKGRNVALLSEKELYNNAINNSGVIVATAIESVGGNIYLSGGNVHISSTAELTGESLNVEANNSIISSGNVDGVKKFNATSKNGSIELSNLGLHEELNVSAENGDISIISDKDINVTGSLSQSIFIDGMAGVKGADIKADKLVVKANGEVDLNVVSSLINVQSTGKITIKNNAIKDVYIENLKSDSFEDLTYTQENNFMLTFSDDMYSDKGKILLNNKAGRIDSIFDVIKNNAMLNIDGNIVNLTNEAGIDLVDSVFYRIFAKKLSLVSETGYVKINIQNPTMQELKFDIISAANEVDINVQKSIDINKLKSGSTALINAGSGNISINSLSAAGEVTLAGANTTVKNLATNGNTNITTIDNSNIDITVASGYQTIFFINNGKNNAIKLTSSADIDVASWLFADFREVILDSKGNINLIDLNFGDNPTKSNNLTIIGQSLNIINGAPDIFYANKLKLTLAEGLNAKIDANYINLKGGNFNIALLSDVGTEFTMLGGEKKYAINVNDLTIVTDFDIKFKDEVAVKNVDIKSNGSDVAFLGVVKADNIKVDGAKNFSLDNDMEVSGFVELFVSNNIKLNGEILSNVFNSKSGSFEFAGSKSSLVSNFMFIDVSASDVAANGLTRNVNSGEIFGNGRIFSGGVLNLSADKIGVNGVLLILAPKATLTARNQIGMSIDFYTTNWLYGVMNYNINTIGAVQINGNNASPKYSMLFSQLEDKYFAPVEDTNMYDVTDYNQSGIGKAFPSDLITIERPQIVESKYLIKVKGKVELR